MERREPLHRVGRASSLTAVGEAEARAGGKLLAEEPGLDLRVLHTSVLTRAIRTAELALGAAQRSWLPVRRDSRFDERHSRIYKGRTRLRQRRSSGRTNYNCGGGATTPRRRH